MPQLVLSIEGVEIRRVNLNHKRTTLGRKPHNDIVLADLVVSGEHCAFNLEGLADVYVEDLHSTNGTYLNGQMVKRQKLRDHDVITVGRIHIEYLSSSPPGEFGKTTAMPPDAAGAVGHAAPHASLRVLSGSSAGLEMPVVKAVTTFGKPGIAIVAGMHRAGTSAIARGLAVLGFDLGPRLMSADVRMNARGQWHGICTSKASSTATSTRITSCMKNKAVRCSAILGRLLCIHPVPQRFTADCNSSKCVRSAVFWKSWSNAAICLQTRTTD